MCERLSEFYWQGNDSSGEAAATNSRSETSAVSQAETPDMDENDAAVSEESQASGAYNCRTARKADKGNRKNINSFLTVDYIY